MYVLIVMSIARDRGLPAAFRRENVDILFDIIVVISTFLSITFKNKYSCLIGVANMYIPNLHQNKRSCIHPQI